MAGQPRVEKKTNSKQRQYLFKVRVSHHTLQRVEDRVSLHGLQGLPCDLAGVVIQSLHFRGCRVEREREDVMRRMIGAICDKEHI